jgi:hypothetical protein
MAFDVKLGAASTGNFKVQFDSPTDNFTLKNQVGAGTRIDSLADVDVTNTSANGSILVYDSSTDTYVQRDILTFDVDSGAFKLEGGSF